MNPQSFELVPHSSPSARPQWSQFLLQWLRRPPGVHSMPSLQPGLPISRSQPFKCHQSAVQRFSPYQLDALQAKKGNEPPKRPTCPSQFSECPSPMVPIPFAVAAAPPGVHMMPSLQPGLPISTSQRFKCHQSAVQSFSPYQLDALQAKKGNEPPKLRTCPSQFSACPSPMVPIPFAVATAPPRGHSMPSLQPGLPISRSQPFKCHRSAVQRFSPYQLDALQAKKGNEPPKRPTCPSQFSGCPSPMVPIPFAVAAAPPGVHMMPSLQPGLPISRSQPFKCHQSAVQRFSPYQLDALQAKKGNEPPKRRTCPSQFSKCPSPMVPIPFAVAAAPPRVHIMPSLQPGLPISTSQRFKCHQSAVQRFSPYQLDALQAKKGNDPPKCRTCPSQFSECPSPMVPIPFAVAAAPHGVDIMPALQHGLSISRSQPFKCHQSAVQRFSPYQLDALQAKKGNEPPKRPTCPSQFSGCPSPMVPIPFAVAAAPPGVHIMPSLQPGLPISTSQPFKCHQSAVQRFSPYQLDALQAKKGNDPPKCRTCPSQFSECPSPMVPIPFAVAAAPHGVDIMPALQHGLSISRSQPFKCHQSAVQRFSPYQLDALQAKKGNEPPKRRSCPSQFSECPSPMVPIPFAVATAPPRGHSMPSLQPGLPISRSQPFKCHRSAVQRFSPYQLDALQAKKGSKLQSVELVPRNSPSARPQWSQFLSQWLRCPLGYTQCPHFNPDSPLADQSLSNVTSQQCRGFHPTSWMHCKQKKAMNPQSVEVVPHSSPSARTQRSRFLLQWLRRPLGYTQCPQFNPGSPLADHNLSNVTNQQCRGFHPTS